MIGKCSIYKLGEFLEGIMEANNEIFFTIQDEYNGSKFDIGYEENINIVNEMYMNSCALRGVVFIIVEDDEYDEAIEKLDGTKEKYDEVFAYIVKNIKDVSEINDYTIGSGGSDLLIVSNEEYGGIKYTIHQREVSYNSNGDACLF